MWYTSSCLVGIPPTWGTVYQEILFGKPHGHKRPVQELQGSYWCRWETLLVAYALIPENVEKAACAPVWKKHLTSDPLFLCFGSVQCSDVSLKLV